MKKLVTQVKLRRELDGGGYATTVGYVDAGLAVKGARLEVAGVVWVVDAVWTSAYFSKDPKDNCFIAWTYRAKKETRRAQTEED